MENVRCCYYQHCAAQVPSIYWDYTTPRVLVMEYCTGAHINDVASLKQQNIDVYDVSDKIGQMYSRWRTIDNDGVVTPACSG